MLDAALLSQLTDVFANLPASLVLSVAPSTHERQAELLDLARAIASTSDRVRVQIEEGDAGPDLRLALLADGAPTGVTFRGVPGGHELTSLVVAMLNAAGKGKLPDPHLRARVRALGPAKLRTYVSLECTNCPDVVQALNLVALLHPDIEHEMVDGALFPEEVARLGIQGVPAVFAGDELVHSGRATLVELLGALEAQLGADAVAPTDRAPPRDYDFVVIGGGPAGASAAIYSARKGLRTALVAYRVGGQLKETVGIENMIGTSYTEGKRLAADLEAHLGAYPIDVLEHRRVRAVDPGERALVALEGGERLRAGAVIVATGAKWRELGVPGEREYLGRGVAFCPHCDGPFYKGKRVAVVGGGNSGVEAAIDLAGIVRHVTLLEFDAKLRADAVLQAKLASLPNVTVITSAQTTEVTGDGAKVTGLVYRERETGAEKRVELEGLFVQIGLLPNTDWLKGAVALTPRGEIEVDARGQTSVPGVFAAGDATTSPFKQIVIAMGDGAKASLAAFDHLIRSGVPAAAPTPTPQRAAA